MTVMWILCAFLSAFFAGVTAILAKIDVKNVDPNLATALRIVVIIFFSWFMVLVVGSQDSLGDIDAKTLVFLIMSGLATGASWICYFKALQIGDVNKVVPIDKSSTVLAMLLAFIFLGEDLSSGQIFSMLLIAVGTYMMIETEVLQIGHSNRRMPNLQESKPLRHRLKRLLQPGDWQFNHHVVKFQTERMKSGTRAVPGGGWLVYALLSAFFASLTAILGKVGIEGIESNLGAAIRTVVVAVMAWGIVLVRGKQRETKDIRGHGWMFIILSGFTTGLSWLFYYRALQEGPASIVVPIDKLSILVTIAFGYLVLHEKLSRRSAAGLTLVTAGTLTLFM